MRRTLILFVMLFMLWLVLSGHYDPLFIGLGLLSSAVAVCIARRMNIIDAEGLPIALLPGLIRYGPWLFGAIIRANLDVARRIIHPRLPIAPLVVRVSAEQQTVAGRVTYANSITLTPGTISLDVTHEDIEVHALSVEAAQDLQSGEMERWIIAMEPDK